MAQATAPILDSTEASVPSIAEIRALLDTKRTFGEAPGRFDPTRLP
jgi:hypothetical protein